MMTAPDPVASLAAAASVHTTPCGDGHMVWHRWGAGRPVVLLHGGSGSWTHWLRTIPALATRYEVWAADLPGLGDSAMPPEPWTPESSGRVVAEGVRALIPSQRTAHLVGFSFGAHVGTYAAIALGERLSGFTITGSAALGLPRPRMDFPKERTGMSPAELAEVHRGTLAMLMIAEPARIDDLAIRVQAENVRRARFKSRKFAPTTEIKDRLADVHVRVSAIWGARDVLARPSVEAVFDILRIHHPGLVTRVVPDAGHWSMYENPDGFNGALLEVLDGGT